MALPAQSEEAPAGIPRVAPDCDATDLILTPEEGFLLSRIDGQTPWELLREIGGLSASEVDQCLARWVDDGVLVLEKEAPAVSEPPGAAPREPGTRPGVLDSSLEIPLDTQRRIIEFDARLDLPYHELLGVEAGASVREVKRAYFRLSREFHPDRFFRKEIGGYAERLERIFRRVLEAHEMLCDPMARAEMERSLAGDSPPVESCPEVDGGSQAGSTISPDDARRELARLAAHARLLAARKLKAKSFFEAGMNAFRSERWLEAAASVRLSIAFDPGNQAYREAFGGVQRKAHEERAKQLEREAEAALEVRDYARSLRSFEEALQFRPHDAELHHRVARLSWLSGTDLRKAKEFARIACEVQPEDASYRLTLGQIYKAAGLVANARRELRRAMELDPTDQEAKTELGSLGKG